jgi:hypothetical protein
MFVLAAALVSAAEKEKKLPSAQYSSDDIEFNATAYLAKEEVKALLGSDLGGAIVVLDVRVAPRLAGKLTIDRDDFVLRSDKDGQTSKPFAPEQIAGSSMLVVSTRSGGGGGIVSEDRGPVWGGIGGGRPQRSGGDGGGIGNSADATTQTSISQTTSDKPNPLLSVLRERVLPQKEITEPATGLLYFSLEGKHKAKDVELIYRGNGLKFAVRFK